MEGDAENVRILFDEMLKNLAHWCRILGIDSEFMTGKSDSQLLDYAGKKGLIFVTRDRPLFDRCRKRGVKCIFVKDEDLEDQIAQVVGETGAKVTFPEKTRCASCNGELEVVPKEGLKGQVPEKTFENQEKFWKCAKCGKVFWEGSHWKNINRIWEDVQMRLSMSPDPAKGRPGEKQ
ncbi:MAG TPA: Mut7-C RNAse domain-containing protein [Candidatus Bilamarchaeum sp.]|nr:Mut7-C RNAse domain-containing protein [Candidatus Bilamarchaeum sp.]